MAATSSCGRFQFSVEKAYTVRYPMPRFSQALVILRNTCAPAA